MSTTTNMGQAQSSAEQIPVLIVGGGPIGLTLAAQLFLRGSTGFTTWT
ncbi:hypothetical protein [Mycobacterium sp.]